MFYFLHRLVKWFWVVLALAGLYWVWLQREAIEPVYVWYDVYENGGIQKTDRLHAIRGRVIRVVDGHTFQMNHDGKHVSVRLTGLEVPQPPLSSGEIEMERERRRVLKEMLLSQEVDVRVTYAAPNSMLGIVSVNDTNLNVFLITNGLARFNGTYVKNVPRDVQYQFFAAQRLREKAEDRKNELASAVPESAPEPSQ